jgi:glutamyl-tRNA reductase
VQARLGSLSAEQVAAVEALTRGLVNKFLHPPMQALKQAAREGDQVRLEAVCEEWSVSAAGDREPERAGARAAEVEAAEAAAEMPATATAEGEPANAATMEIRR